METPTTMEDGSERKRPGWFGWLLGWGAAYVRLFFGVLLCQLLLGAVLVVGWSLRMMQAVTHGRWQRIALEQPSDARILPNWFMAQDARERWKAMWNENRWRLIYPPWALKQLFGSLWRNLKTGVQALFNVWVLTLPGMSLWVFSWYAGWNNSFHKGYENAFIGPSTGILGILLFIIAMLFVPMAVARQASTGEWKRFYEWRVVNRLIAETPISYLFLSLAYTLFSIPVSMMIALRMFIPNMFEEGLPESAVAQLEIIQSYSFWLGVVGFVLYLTLRWIAARIYAKSMLKALARGSLRSENLSENERVVLQPWLDTLQPEVRSSWLYKGWYSVGWASTLAILMIIWFSFAAQIYVRQFFIYDSVRGWVNQPLVHMPWFHYVPQSIKDAAQLERDAE